MPESAAIDVADASQPEQGPAAEDPYAMETPFDCFRRPDVIETLRSHPQTRPYSLDSGFLKQIENMKNAKTQQEESCIAMSDPRLMQAMGVLQDWGLTVTEKEMKHAAVRKVRSLCCLSSHASRSR